MLLWFGSLFCIGLWRINSERTILRALNPVEAILYLIREKRNGFTQIGEENVVPIASFSSLCSGGVFLSVTGCEALFADLGQMGVSFSSFIDLPMFEGHFGLWPVRLSWFLVVFPCVVTNYLGQGAFLIVHPEFYQNP